MSSSDVISGTREPSRPIFVQISRASAALAKVSRRRTNSACFARSEARRGDCAGVHHRVREAAGASFDGGDRVERMPGRVGPDFCPRLRRPEMLADERVDKRLRHAHDRKFKAGVARMKNPPAHPDDTNSEQSGFHPRQRRIHLGILPVRHWRKPAVGLVDENLNQLRRGKASSRNKTVRLPRRVFFWGIHENRRRL